jgi:hypothetical protein
MENMKFLELLVQIPGSYLNLGKKVESKILFIAHPTSRTVPGSIPGGVSGFFSDIFLPTVPRPWGRLSP